MLDNSERQQKIICFRVLKLIYELLKKKKLMGFSIVLKICLKDTIQSIADKR